MTRNHRVFHGKNEFVGGQETSNSFEESWSFVSRNSVSPSPDNTRGNLLYYLKKSEFG